MTPVPHATSHWLSVTEHPVGTCDPELTGPQVGFCFYKAFLRHLSPSYLLDDLEELQFLTCIPS